MPGSVLVPLDGSPLAEAVLPIAVRLARGAGRPLSLLSVVTPLEFTPPIVGLGTPYVTPVTGAQLEDLEAQEMESRTAYLQEIAERLRRPDLPVRYTVQRGPEPAAVIKAYARRIDAWLIAMSTHGRSGISEWLYGSVAKGVLQNSTQPILLLRPSDATPQRPADVRPGVLVPLDGGPVAEAALDPACQIARAMGGEITLLEVVPPIPPSASGLLKVVEPIVEEPVVREDDARQYLDDVRTRLQESGCPASFMVVFGLPADEIVAAAQSNAIGFIVMVTRAPTDGQAPTFASAADDVLRRAQRPVVFVPPAKAVSLPPAGGPTISVALTQRERALVKLALDRLARNAPEGIVSRDEVRQLLDRL